MSAQKMTLMVAAAACAPYLLAHAQSPTATTDPSSTSTTTTAAPATTTTTPVPVNLNQNIVTTVLILGVSIAVTVIYALSKLIPRYRRGEISFSKIEFDWRAELLNQTSKKEKARRAEEKARREEERAAGRYGDVDESGMRNESDTQPRVEMHEADEPHAGEYGGRSHHNHRDEDAHVTFPREHRE